MVISYPTHYIVSAMPIISLDEDEYLTSSDENIIQNDEFLLRSDKYTSLKDMNGNEAYIPSENKNINNFEEVDLEYVNNTVPTLVSNTIDSTNNNNNNNNNNI